MRIVFEAIQLAHALSAELAAAEKTGGLECKGLKSL